MIRAARNNKKCHVQPLEGSPSRWIDLIFVVRNPGKARLPEGATFSLYSPSGGSDRFDVLRNHCNVRPQDGSILSLSCVTPVGLAFRRERQFLCHVQPLEGSPSRWIDFIFVVRTPGKARLPEGSTFFLSFVTPVRENVYPSSLRRLHMRTIIPN